MQLGLTTIPDVDPVWEQSHQIRALEIGGRSPFLDELANWKSREASDHKKIMKVMERVARMERVQDEKHVKADARKTGIYEMRAHRGKARVLFFYDDDPARTAICVHTYWKGSGNQTNAFNQAEAMMRMWKCSHQS